MSGVLAIETRSLERTFKAGVEAVRGVDLRVAAGEVFGFLGPPADEDLLRGDEAPPRPRERENYDR